MRKTNFSSDKTRNLTSKVVADTFGQYAAMGFSGIVHTALHIADRCLDNYNGGHWVARAVKSEQQEDYAWFLVNSVENAHELVTVRNWLTNEEVQLPMDVAGAILTIYSLCILIERGSRNAVDDSLLAPLLSLHTRLIESVYNWASQHDDDHGTAYFARAFALLD